MGFGCWLVACAVDCQIRHIFGDTRGGELKADGWSKDELVSLKEAVSKYPLFHIYCTVLFHLETHRVAHFQIFAIRCISTGIYHTIC